MYDSASLRHDVCASVNYSDYELSIVSSIAICEINRFGWAKNSCTSAWSVEKNVTYIGSWRISIYGEDVDLRQSPRKESKLEWSQPPAAAWKLYALGNYHAPSSRALYQMFLYRGLYGIIRNHITCRFCFLLLVGLSTYNWNDLDDDVSTDACYFHGEFDW